MSHATRKISWIIAYDIASPKRLVRVHRYMKRHGIPLQYSVFMTRGTEGYIDNILAGLGGIINWRDDDVRAYPVPENPEIYWIGKKPLPGDVTFSLLPNLEDMLISRGINTDDETLPISVPQEKSEEEDDGGILLC